MSIFSSALRAVVIIAGLSALGAGVAYACDCDGPAYHDDYHHDDGWRHDGDHYDGDHRDGYRDGDRYDGCRDDCHRHDDGCRDHCYRADYGCHDGCYRHYDGCHDGCYRGSANYSCYAGRFDCRLEDSCCDAGFRARFYDDHYARSYGGAYGYYGN